MSEKIHGVPAEAIIKVVQRIEAKHGVCHPSALVEAARSPKSPIHGLFEWDDSEAALRWRAHQARNVINSLRVVVEDRAEPAIAFVHVRHVTPEGVTEGYMSAARAMAGPTRDGVLRDALAYLKGARRRYEQLAELGPVWDALDGLDAVAAEDGEREAA